MKLLASDIIFTKLSTKSLLLWRCRVSFEYQGLLQNTPASFLLLFVKFKLHCKRHYRNLATYSWCTTWREHVTKMAPARRRHSVGGGGGAAAAAHSSITNQILNQHWWMSSHTMLSHRQFFCAISHSLSFSFCYLNCSVRLQNDLYCVGWGVKLYSLTHRFKRCRVHSPFHNE